MIQRIFGILFSRYLEIKGRGKNIQEWMETIQASGLDLIEGYTKVTDSEKNRKQLSHVIGIEKWSNRRLEVALGEPFLEGEYNDFRPARETDWEELQSQFRETREETVLNVARLITEDVDPTTKIKHNQMGDLTVLGWLNYIDTHATFESGQIK